MQDKDQHDPCFEHEAQIAIVQQLEALVASVDRNTAAIYDTAKAQAELDIVPGDNFVYAIEKILECLDPTSTVFGVLKRGLDKIKRARQS